MAIYRIHPSIGIARVGDSDQYYIAPETPGGLPILPDGKPFTPSDFRDGNRRLRRQGARFTVFRHDTPDGPGVEVQPGEGGVKAVEWTVHLANKKAAWYQFLVNSGEAGYTPDHPFRNPSVTDPADRKKLMIDPGWRRLDGPDQSVEFSRQDNPHGYPMTFPPENLEPCPINTLGGLRTDGQGRLVVLGGHGRSGSSVKPHIVDYANNDDWWDDTSDGPVTARIVLEDGTAPDAVPSWVLVAPPRFAPQLLNLVTLWDTMFDTLVRNLDFRPDIFHDGLWNRDYVPSWEEDILPVLNRAEHYPWVAPIPAKPHQFDFDELSDPDPGNNHLRRHYLKVLRPPSATNTFEASFAGKMLPMMPYLAGDNAFELGPLWSSYLTITATQYFFLQQWAEGKFSTGSPKPLPPGEALDRAALENCVGGAFSPGIEMTWVSRNPSIYEEPFRLRHRPDVQPPLSLGLDLQAGFEPGDVSKFMALPWQADYNECSSQAVQQSSAQPQPAPTGPTVFWWPVQRPLAVYRKDGNHFKQEAWIGSLDPNADNYLQFQHDLEMVTRWKHQGFIVRNDVEGQPRFIEVERVPGPPGPDPDCGAGG